MSKTALLVVDVLTAIINEHPYREDELIANISDLIFLSRKSGVEVIYVRHDGGNGDELEKNSEGWQIYNNIAPEKDEKIIDKVRSSAFRDTRLKEYLDGEKISTLVIVGLQTEYCIDATIKVAFEFGYRVFIPDESTSTFDNGKMSAADLCEHYNKIWHNRFAQVISLDAAKKLLL